MSYILILLMLAVPFIVYFALAPELAGRSPRPLYCLLVFTAFGACTLAVMSLLIFLLTFFNSPTNCEAAWQCDLAEAFNPHRWWFIAASFAFFFTGSFSVQLCDLIAQPDQVIPARND